MAQPAILMDWGAMEGTRKLPPTLTPNPSSCCRDVHEYDAVNYAGADVCNSGLTLTTIKTPSSLVHDFTYFTALNFHFTYFHCFD
jgi:hypothetical protein